MGHHAEVTREISYASSAQSGGGRALIRVLENMTGRLGLIRRAAGYETEVAAGRDFWSVMLARYGLTLELVAGGLGNIPRQGPLVVVANHPYGILDGLVLGHILSETRGEFRILANRVFRKAEALNRMILPISFDETRDAVRENVETRRIAHEELRAGGCVGVFPGGTVSTARRPFGPPMDPGWRGFTGRLIRRSGAAVVPVFFDGANSRLFQLASHVHSTLRLALLIKEFGRRVDQPVRVAVGRPIDPARLKALGPEPRAMMDFLRAETYKLSPRPLKSLAYGFEFEEKHKS